MRKAALIVGLMYAIWGGWHLFAILNILPLYRQFNTTTSLSLYFFPIMILVFSLVCIIAFFLNLKSQLFYKIIVFLGAGGVIFYFVNLVWSSYLVNTQIDKIINEFQSQP